MASTVSAAASLADRQLAQRLSGYRFVSTDTLTGQVLCDDLPLVGQSASRQINNIGQFSGSLTLAQNVTPAQRSYWINSMLPYKSILWILQNGVPIWNGPVTGLPHDSLSGGNLPVQAATMEQFFNYRQITDDLTYTNTDVFEIFRQELQYALSKTPNGMISGSGTFQNQAGVVDTLQYSGITGSITEQASYKSIYSAWGDLVDMYLLEFALTPAMTSDGSLYTITQMGIPQMGRTYAETGFQLVIPAYHMQDYGWQWVPQNPANRLVVSGYGASENYISIATANTELANGYPLLEGNTSYFGTVTGQDQLNQFAIGSLYPLMITAGLTPVVYGGDGSLPFVNQVILGDEAMFAGTSDLHPAGPYGAPGITQLFQITGWTLTFPTGQQAEQIAWQLGLGPTQLGSITAIAGPETSD